MADSFDLSLRESSKMPEIPENPFFQFLENSFSAETMTVVEIIPILFLGGAMSIYLRWLYRKFGASPSDADSFTRVFPMLVIVTAAIISILQTSLALSLGMVGALSIVRFRAAIKEPEELVYLFLCVGVGLSLGAQQIFLAVCAIAVSSVFVIAMHYGNSRRNSEQFLLTVSADSKHYTEDKENNVIHLVEQLAGKCAVHRVDLENGRGQARIMLPRTNSEDLTVIISNLRDQVPDCELSYVNLDSAW